MIRPRAIRAAPLVAIAALLAAGPARGQEGFDGLSAIASPTANALVPIRRSDVRNEVAVLAGTAAVDQGQVHGLARAALQLEGSWAAAPRWELWGTVNPLAYRWVQVTIPVQGQVVYRTLERLAFGSSTLGVTWAPVALPRGALAGGLFLRVLLPTSTEVAGAHAWGTQLGASFRGLLTRWMGWYGGASLRLSQGWGSIPVTPSDPDPDRFRTGASAALGLAFVPAAWVRLVAQVSGNLPFDGTAAQLSPAVGVRLVQGDVSADLGAVLTLGAPLRPFSAVGRVAWRFDG